MTRVLIVNADDFGRNEAINRGVREAHKRGVVTSASLMVRWPAARSAASYARDRARFSLGLHLDLAEWTHSAAGWQTSYVRVPLDKPGAVTREVGEQLRLFRALVGSDPTHLDSHQHVHHEEPVRSAVLTVADELGVPLRGFTSGIRYCGDFYGQTAKGDPLPAGIEVDALVSLLEQLPDGVTELGCHPGLGDDLEPPYAAERAHEVRTLCDRMVVETLEREGIELASFSEATSRRSRNAAKEG
jgi:chitin disaccharide deacetylase